MWSVTLRDGLRVQHRELQQAREGSRGLGFSGLG